MRKQIVNFLPKIDEIKLLSCVNARVPTREPDEPQIEFYRIRLGAAKLSDYIAIQIKDSAAVLVKEGKIFNGLCAGVSITA